MVEVIDQKRDILGNITAYIPLAGKEFRILVGTVGGNYLVDGIKADGPLNDGGDPHLVITIEPGIGENTDKKLEEAGW